MQYWADPKAAREKIIELEDKLERLRRHIHTARIWLAGIEKLLGEEDAT